MKPQPQVGRGVSGLQHRGRWCRVAVAQLSFPWAAVTPPPRREEPAGSRLRGWEHRPGLDGGGLWPTRLTSPLIRSSGRGAPLSRDLRSLEKGKEASQQKKNPEWLTPVAHVRDFIGGQEPQGL